MQRALRTCLASAAALAAVLPCARADDVQVTGSVLPGHLGIDASPTRVALPRAKKARVAASLSVPFVVTDTRGNGAGWAVALTATAQTTRGARVHGLSVEVRSFTMTCHACRKPVDRVDYPLGLPLGKATRVFRAAHGSGMGVIHLAAHLTVAGTPKPAARGLRLTVRLAQVSGP
jgi:hypothetical protein